MAHLHRHCRKYADHAIPSMLLLTWISRIYRLKGIAKNNQLDQTLLNVRKCQEDVVQVLELPMPFQYFHIMNLMLALNLLLWAYALGCEDSYFAPVIFFFLQLMFQGIRELCTGLADPYGDDEVDFPLNDWMTQLYVRVCAMTEDNWDVGTMIPKGTLPPLPELKGDAQVIDLLVDVHKQVHGGDRRDVRRESRREDGRRRSDDNRENLDWDRDRGRDAETLSPLLGNG